MKLRSFATAVLGLLSVPLLGATQHHGEQDIYYTSQARADAELAEFDRGHSDCQLWTNWQKMCSRSGPGGRTSCKTSVRRDLRPSAPFCVGKEDGGIRRPYESGGFRRPDESDGSRALQSSLRFCIYPAGKPATLEAQIEACEYLPSRPFGGHDLREQAHSWCATWKEAGHVRPASYGRRPKYGFFCSVPRVPSWCSWPEGLGYGPVKAMPGVDPEDALLPTLLNPDSRAVHGVFCRRTVK